MGGRDPGFPNIAGRSVVKHVGGGGQPPCPGLVFRVEPGSQGLGQPTMLCVRRKESFPDAGPQTLVIGGGGEGAGPIVRRVSV